MNAHGGPALSFRGVRRRHFRVAGIAAVFAPNLASLIVLRIVQGACAAAITPAVIAILGGPLWPSRRLWLWQALAVPVAVGDAVTLTVGCDKSFATCGATFSNRKNFRGSAQRNYFC